MTKELRGTVAVIDAISRDSGVAHDVVAVAKALRTLYPGTAARARLHNAVDALLNDDGWSPDQQPRMWLSEIEVELAAGA